MAPSDTPPPQEALLDADVSGEAHSPTQSGWSQWRLPASKPPLPKESLTDADRHLIHLITNLSAHRACTATTKTLTKRTGKSSRSVAESLSRLERAGVIIRETTAFDPRRGCRGRTIYIISARSEDEGARALVRRLRQNGKVTTRTSDVLCGWLACTPEQLEKWISVAAAKGWLTVGHQDNKFILTRTDTAPYYERRFWKKQEPRPEIHYAPPRRRDLAERVMSYFSSATHHTSTWDEAATAIDSTPGSVRVTVGKLVAAGKLFRGTTADG